VFYPCSTLAIVFRSDGVELIYSDILTQISWVGIIPDYPVPGFPVDLTFTAGFPHYPGLVLLTAGELPPGPFRVGLTIP
jgi:hypothetical protein